MSRPALIEQAVADWWPGARVAQIWKLEGGMSADLYGAQILGAEVEQIVARFPSPYLATLFPDPAGHEFDVLREVKRAGLPAPAPLWKSAGLLLMELLPGKATACFPEPGDAVEQMALALAAIHAAPVDDLAFLLPTRTGHVPKAADPPRNDLREVDVVVALAECVPGELGPFGLRHGDFWPGNMLWEEGRLTGIIDWENALLGPAIADLAISQLDVAWILGFAAMEEFTRAYLERSPLDLATLKYWQLRAAHRPMANFEEWAGPYTALGRPDVTTESMKEVLLRFIGLALGEGEQGADSAAP